MSVLYADRLRNNYNLTGEAWGADLVVLDDLETCGLISQASIDAIGSGLQE